MSFGTNVQYPKHPPHAHNTTHHPSTRGVVKGRGATRNKWGICLVTISVQDTPETRLQKNSGGHLGVGGCANRLELEWSPTPTKGYFAFLKSPSSVPLHSQGVDWFQECSVQKSATSICTGLYTPCLGIGPCPFVCIDPFPLHSQGVGSGV